MNRWRLKAVEAAGEEDYEIPQGYVDRSGILQKLPERYAGLLEAYPDERSAREALDFGDIDAYILIPEDYLASGALTYVQAEFNPLLALQDSAWIRHALSINLLGNNESLADLVRNPLNLRVTILEPGSERDTNNPANMVVPYATAGLFYMLIFFTSSILLVGISREKENRLLEILISSVSPKQLIAGKMLGLGLVGLFEVLAWIGMGMAILRLNGELFSVSTEFDPALSFLAWGLAFFLLGYAVYASLMAGIGALASNLSQGSQISTLLLLPLLIPVAMFSTFLHEPNGPAAVAVSLFPFTSPVAMMARLASSDSVPLWQILLSLVLLALTVALIIQLTTRLFQAQVMLSGQNLTRENLRQVFTNRKPQEE